MHAEERSARNHVEPAVLREKLQTCRDFGKRLDLVKEKQRPAGRKPKGRINQRNAPDDFRRGEPAVGDAQELRTLDKVDFDNRIVAPRRKMPDRLRLPDLAGTLHQQRLPAPVPRPFVEQPVNLPWNVFHGNPRLRCGILCHSPRRVNTKIEYKILSFHTKTQHKKGCMDTK